MKPLDSARLSDDTRQARPFCRVCNRPSAACYCAHIVPVATQTRVVLLQHPRERNMPIGTAHMAHLCLPNSELHVGLDWQASPELARALGDPARTPVLLYPGPGSRDIQLEPPHGPVTLVVVDGTWWQTKKLVQTNPVLANLPRVSFRPRAESEYRIRREPDAQYVSTIEALAEVLGILEGDYRRFEALRTPFRKMVDTQIACREQRGNSGRDGVRRPRRKRSPYPAALSDPDGSLVCVMGEANAWPFGAAVRGSADYHDELVHWVACRLKRGQDGNFDKPDAVFDSLARPVGQLAPRTCELTEITASELGAASSPADLRRAWQAFLQPTDTLCSWGPFALGIFQDSGAAVPAQVCDLRDLARTLLREKAGSLEEYCARRGVLAQPAQARGRAGRRLAQLRAVAETFAADAAIIELAPNIIPRLPVAR